MSRKPRNRQMFVCLECRQGLMDPVSDSSHGSQPDRYQCSYCGHQATIPPLGVALSQLSTCLAGIVITLFLLFQHLSASLRAFQLNTGDYLPDLLLSLLGGVFLIGFLATVLSAFSSLKKHHRYRRISAR